MGIIFNFDHVSSETTLVCSTVAQMTSVHVPTHLRGFTPSGGGGTDRHQSEVFLRCVEGCWGSHWGTQREATNRWSLFYSLRRIGGLNHLFFGGAG